MELDIYDETGEVSPEHIRLIESILQMAADYLKLKDNTEMSVTLVDNDTIREINRQYRDKDSATDVISFAIEDEVEDELPLNLEEMEGLPRELGDIFISIERTQEQARDYGHSFERELGFLAVHGFLHLNGYDHMTPEDEKEMFGLQNEILKEYGLERR
ncbi:rRNA maturation RNase YbeY [Atopococcus tabaci]|uniref:rRNA maturation RNase YbeY n=1 Tax=Atopococcus tabaci TaxID=269774 RepID=UPI000422095E|nr:rRNA maturation RNase YbeY [Atopococcus tabaci]